MARFQKIAKGRSPPTLIVAGGPGSHIPQDAIAKVARTIPDCRLVTIEAGHLVHEERPEEFGAEIAAFLS